MLLLRKLKEKFFFSENIFKKLNLNTQIIDGHNYKQILKAFNKTKRKNESCVIIANTVKGKDFGKLENNLKYSHHLPSLNVIEALIYYNFDELLSNHLSYL